ncbi:pilus assembly FimT family protein [Thermosulfurimonas dismutans]|uniref:pilus assembly FimT family protein n=1 Tax=Thermosulfurimonas dismutans TaxID=999894 RepID=UPI0008399F4C|nr:prepilin-type N-terminal cleavage/methylation domain-containing protein [Thermosulfurimonas dismutans]
MKRWQGLTLIELMVVIALIALLSGFSIVWVKGIVKKHKIAKDIQLLFSSLQEARYLAFTRKTTCGVVLGNSTSPFSSFEIRCDNDSDGDIENGFNLIQRIQLSESYNSSRMVISFSKEGFTTDTCTISPLELHDLPENSCIVVSNTRIKMGMWRNSNCELR